MFGVSFLEIAVIGLVALIIVGPQKLPGMMRTAGEWIGKLRRLTSDVRAQTGIDDILREEGIDGVAELRTLLRGQYNMRNVMSPQQRSSAQWSQSPPQDPDPLLEFPIEGADCSSALADDLLSESEPTVAEADDDEPEPAALSAQAEEPTVEQASSSDALNSPTATETADDTSSKSAS